MIIHKKNTIVEPSKYIKDTIKEKYNINQWDDRDDLKLLDAIDNYRNSIY